MATDCSLGEGLHWHPSSASMYFVDIRGACVHAYCLTNRHLRTWSLPEPVGWVIAGPDPDYFVVGLKNGFALSTFRSEPTVHWIKKIDHGLSSIRLNDAKADAAGRIWAGTLDDVDNPKLVGSLFCLDVDGSLKTVDTGYGIANGPAISPDSKLFLHTDSSRRIIYAFDLDVSCGALSSKRIWKVLSDDEGYPDGMTFDARGNLWLAHWGAGLVSQYSPSGVLLRRVELPASNVSNVAFGGKDLDRIFVTTARYGLTEKQRHEEPLSGGLFEITKHDSIGLLPSTSCRR